MYPWMYNSKVHVPQSFGFLNYLREIAVAVPCPRAVDVKPNLISIGHFQQVEREDPGPCSMGWIGAKIPDLVGLWAGHWRRHPVFCSSLSLDINTSLKLVSLVQSNSILNPWITNSCPPTAAHSQFACSWRVPFTTTNCEIIFLKWAPSSNTKWPFIGPHIYICFNLWLILFTDR